MKEKITYRINVRWNGAWRISPKAYETVEAAHADLLPFMRQFSGRFLQFTLVVERTWADENS